MKKTITTLVLLLAFIFGTNAQPPQQKRLSVDKFLKKMTEDLDLNADQQSQIKPLLETEMKERRKHFEERKKLRDSGERPSKEERKQMMQERIKKEKEMNAKMKNILSEEQFVKFLAIKKELREKRMQKRKTNNKQ